MSISGRVGYRETGKGRRTLGLGSGKWGVGSGLWKKETRVGGRSIGEFGQRNICHLNFWIVI